MVLLCLVKYALLRIVVPYKLDPRLYHCCGIGFAVYFKDTKFLFFFTHLLIIAFVVK